MNLIIGSMTFHHLYFSGCDIIRDHDKGRSNLDLDGHPWTKTKVDLEPEI